MTSLSFPDIRRLTSAGQTEQLIRHAHVILAACGRTMSANRVVRVVRDYERCIERNGWVFWDFLTNAMLLDEQQKARFEADPDLYQTITYIDRTGEEAVNNVLREQRGA